MANPCFAERGHDWFLGTLGTSDALPEFDDDVFLYGFQMINCTIFNGSLQIQSLFIVLDARKNPGFVNK